MMGWLLVRIRAVQDRIASQVMSAFCMVSERPSLRLTQLNMNSGTATRRRGAAAIARGGEEVTKHRHCYYVVATGSNQEKEE